MSVGQRNAVAVLIDCLIKEQLPVLNDPNEIQTQESKTPFSNSVVLESEKFHIF